MARSLSVIGAPSSAGAYAPGQETAPAAFRRHGLLAALEGTGLQVTDRGDGELFRWRPDPTRPDAMNLEAVVRAAQAARRQVAEALDADHRVLVLGGDCTVELGVVAAAAMDGSTVGLVYIDGDADLNTPATAEGALDWTGVAHLLDLPGSLRELSGLGARRPLLSPDDVVLFGAHEVTPPEAQAIRDLGIGHVSLADATADPGLAARRVAAWGARFDRLLVHLDIDVLAFTGFPISENVRVGARDRGLSLDALTAVLAVLLAAPNWTALTVTEVNPDHAPDEAESFRQLIGILAKALSGAAPGH